VTKSTDSTEPTTAPTLIVVVVEGGAGTTVMEIITEFAAATQAPFTGTLIKGTKGLPTQSAVS
jgi:hypothetical protein